MGKAKHKFSISKSRDFISRRRPPVKAGRKLDAKESRVGYAWAILSQFFGLRSRR